MLVSDLILFPVKLSGLFVERGHQDIWLLGQGSSITSTQWNCKTVEYDWPESSVL